MDLCSWLQLLQGTAQDSTEDKANLVTLCKVVSALPVTPEHMRSSRIGHVLSSLSKDSLPDVSEAATKSRDLLRDRMKSLQVPGGLSKRSIAPAQTPSVPTRASSDNAHPSAEGTAGDPIDSEQPAPASSVQQQCAHDPKPASMETGAMQGGADGEEATVSVPVPPGHPAAIADAVQPGGKGDAAVGNGKLSRIQASIIGPARKATEAVVANLKRTFSSGGPAGTASTAAAGGAAGVSATYVVDMYHLRAGDRRASSRNSCMCMLQVESRMGRVRCRGRGTEASLEAGVAASGPSHQGAHRYSRRRRHLQL